MHGRAIGLLALGCLGLAASACTRGDAGRSSLDGCAAPASPPAVEASTTDTSPHRSQFVEVGGVRLHYLDWGGNGDALVFLTGLGNTAHVFDDFAPCFIPDHRVVALTRRGFGESAMPDSGYDRRTLANDILGLIDGLGLDRVTLIGHSIAGEEMTRFAGMYPERTAGLVYIDAAYDRLAAAQALPPYPGGETPPATSTDSTSLEAIGNYLAYLFRVSLPDAEVRAMFTTNPDGSVSGRTVGQAARVQIPRFRESPDYSSVRAPALALYKSINRPDLQLPWADSATLALVREWQDDHARPELERQMEAFLKIPEGCAQVIEGFHYLFISNRDEVAKTTRDFLEDGSC